MNHDVELRRRITQESIDQSRRPAPSSLEIPIDAKLFEALRPMVRRYQEDGYKGTAEQWERLTRLLRMRGRT